MDEHKNWVRDVFDRAAPQYGQKSCSFFNYFGKRLVELVKIAPNQCALDVATGRGAVLFPLAEAIGPLGKVTGIDISQQMLKETAKQAKGMDWVDLHPMDAEQLHFPDHHFDLVFCGFGLFFLPSVQAALSECKRVLKPEGKLAVSIWGKESELKSWIGNATKQFDIKKNLSITPLRSESSLRAVLTDTGFDPIHILEESKVFFHHTAEEWWESLWTHGTRARFEQLTYDQLVSLREKAIMKAKNLDKGQGVPEELQVFYGIAQKS